MTPTHNPRIRRFNEHFSGLTFGSCNPFDNRKQANGFTASAAVALLLGLFFALQPANPTVADDAPAAPSQRMLILHADDAGMSHSVNVGTIAALEAGIVSSVSIMVPCPWFTEFANYAATHPEYDYGIHLVLNSEWQTYRWKPVSPQPADSSLLDKDGYFPRSVPEVVERANAKEVDRELRAQIDKALAAGIRITHLDTHMGALASRPDLAMVYVQLGLDYKLPILYVEVPAEQQAAVLTEASRGSWNAAKAAVLERVAELHAAGLPGVVGLVPGPQSAELLPRKQQYLKTLRELKPGVSELIIHCATADPELKAMTNAWLDRENDRLIFSDPEIAAEIKKMNIELISWETHRRRHGKPAE